MSDARTKHIAMLIGQCAIVWAMTAGVQVRAGTDWAAEFPGQTITAVASYDLNESSGNTIKDSNGNADGTINSNPAIAAALGPDKSGFTGAAGDRAYVFKSQPTKSYAGLPTIPHSDKFDLASQDGFIYEADIYLGNLTNDTTQIMGRWAGRKPVANVTVRLLSGDRVYFGSYVRTTGGYPFNAVSLPLENATQGWIHVALTYDGLTHVSKLWVTGKDGETRSIQISDVALANPASDNGLYFGWFGNPQSSSFDGRIDNVRYSILHRVP